MRIIKVNIPKSAINNGLEKVEMDRLGQIVLLVGKNGAGKTRLLNLITQIINLKPTKSRFDDISKEIDNYKHDIGERRRLIKAIEKTMEIDTNENQKKLLEGNIQLNKNQIESRQRAIEKNQNILDWNMIETDDLYESYTIVPIIPKRLDIHDCNSIRKDEIDSLAKDIDSISVNSLADGTFARIQTTQEKWFNATQQDSKVPHEEKQIAIEDYEKLKELIKVFLNATIERNLSGEPTLFGFPLGQANLSEGQKVLIQLCLAIHCQKKSLDNIILFLDEPEIHLHSSVIIELIDIIIRNTPNGQLWIATHSIPLLSYFDPSSIWSMDENKVSFAGSIPEIVLNSLLGDDN